MLKDSLSALLDGECTGAELDRLLLEIDRSPALAREWSRMCLAREAREGTKVRADQPCICTDVMGRLDATPGADTKLVDLAVHRATRSLAFSRIWKPAIGLAAAASMGAAAVLLVRPAAPGAAPAGNAIASSGEMARWAPVSFSNPRPAVLSEEQAHAEMLREYLIDHSSAVADEGMGGTLRYARFAAHTAEYRPQSDELP